MIDIEDMVEQLYQASLDQTNVSKEKMRLILNLALQKQCNNNLDIIYKYLNQWSATKVLGSEDNDPTSRLIKLLFSLITDDINDEVKEYGKLSVNYNIK